MHDQLVPTSTDPTTDIMLYLILILYVTIVESIVNPLGPTVSSEYSSCVNNLVDSNFEKSGLVFVGNTLNTTTSILRIREDIVKYLNDKLLYSIQIASPKEEDVECDVINNVCDDIKIVKMEKFTVILLADYYILIVSGFTEFKNMVDKLVTLRTWNPRAYFLILCFTITNLHELPSKNYPARMITYLFKRNAINVVVILPDYKDYRIGIVYGWRPYDPPIYCGYHNETADNRILVENICEYGLLRKKTKLFENRVPNDETGCYMDVVALERQPYISDDPDDPNVEKMLLEEVTELFNLKIKYELINDFRGEKDHKGEWTGALMNIVNGKGDILFGGVFPDYDVHEDFDSSVSYLEDSYTWVVPRAYKSPPWVALIVIYKKLVWLTAGATFAVCVLAWKAFAVLSDDSKYHKCFSHCLLNTWYISLGFASYMQPVRHSLRVFFMFLNIYCILFLTAYQTKLIDVLTHPSYEKQVKTVQELINSDLKIGGVEELRDLFENSTEPDNYKIGEEWISVVDVEVALINVVVHRNFSVLCSRLELQYLSAVMPELSDNFGNPTYYEFEGSVFNVPLEIVTLKGYPLLKRINSFLSVFKQIGVIERIRRIFTNLVAVRKGKLLTKTETDNALSLRHLEGGFLVLIVGYLSGSTALICELIWNTNYIQNQYSKLIENINRKLKKYSNKSINK